MASKTSQTDLAAAGHLPTQPGHGPATDALVSFALDTIFLLQSHWRQRRGDYRDLTTQEGQDAFHRQREGFGVETTRGMAYVPDMFDWLLGELDLSPQLVFAAFAHCGWLEGAMSKNGHRVSISTGASGKPLTVLIIKREYLRGNGLDPFVRRMAATQQEARSPSARSEWTLIDLNQLKTYVHIYDVADALDSPVKRQRLLDCEAAIREDATHGTNRCTPDMLRDLRCLEREARLRVALRQKVFARKQQRSPHSRPRSHWVTRGWLGPCSVPEGMVSTDNEAAALAPADAATVGDEPVAQDTQTAPSGPPDRSLS